MVTRECIYYINLRQAYLLSPLYAQRMSSRTVLFTCVPDAYLDEAKLRKVFGPSVKSIWIATDTKELDKLVEERDKVALNLEAAEIKLIKLANAERTKAIKNDASIGEENVGGDVDAESGSVAARWIKQNQRPTHRLKPLIGKKVDTIDWSRSHLETLIPKINDAQAAHRAGEGKYMPSVFIEFNTQSEAQAAYQILAHHQPLHMAPRYIGITPSEVIWSSLRIKPLELVVRNVLVTGFIAALIVFWSIPVGVVGIISNVNYITNKVHFLSFINHIPAVIRGVINGLLPSILLSVLMSLVPVIMRCK
jgi:hypothetical protein